MTRPSPSESGAADALALGLSLVLGAAALAPALLLRSHAGWAKCRDEVLVEPAAAPSDPRRAPGGNPVLPALAAADAMRPQASASAFRQDPARVLRAWAAAPVAARVAGLDGSVSEGRLTLRWTPFPSSRGTLVRVDGLGGSEAFERELPASESTVVLPVPGAAGTAVARATPLGLPGPAAEVRVAIPFRIAVEVVGAGNASPESGGAILVLRRAYDGRTVDAEFPLHEGDEVGGLSPAGPDGPPVEFRTEFVLFSVRARAPDDGDPGESVPDFDSEGRVERDGAGVPVLRRRGEGAAPGAPEVVLRGPNNERKVLVAR